jgi:hypothetical protein
MPTTHTIISYKYNELGPTAQEVARDWYRQGALDYDWWDSVYDDAERIGLKITGFDLGRRQECSGRFETSARGVAQAIVKEHGEGTDTRKLAEAFLSETTEDADTYGEDVEAFHRDLLRCYWSILDREADYLTSDECIAENIEANEYDFDVNGNRFVCHNTSCT